MNDVARAVRDFDRSAQADRRQLAPHRPSGGSDARCVFGTRIEYVAHPSFDDPDARDAILAPMPGPSADGAERRHRLPASVRPEIACLYEAPLLSREQETHQFRKMNCLKHLAEQARLRLGPGRPRRRDLEEFERLRIEVAEVRQQIIRANLRLVSSIARRFAGRLSDLAELISVGNLALIRAVDKFDFARGHKFSTYATWAIRNEFRSDRRDQRLRGRFVPACSAILQDTVDMRADLVEQQLAQDRRERSVAHLLRRLDDRERRILVGRFGIGGVREETLSQISAELGISKERVRQVEARALDRLRRCARTEGRILSPA
jgi:RNA polymerase primary sigma factor